MSYPARLDEADRFVHQCVRRYVQERPPPATPSGEVWVDRARSAGVLSTVAANLSRHGRSVPVEVRQHRVMHAAVEMSALRAAQRMGTVLDRVGVPWAVLKGPVLGQVIYREAGVREYSDLDVLVAPDAFRDAVTALIADGAVLADTDWSHITRNRTAELGMVLPGGTLLDLHWSLINIGRVRDAFPRLNGAELLVGRVQRQVGPFRLSTLDDCAAVLHVLLHAALSGAHRLRWLLDVQQSLTWLPPTAMAELASRAREMGLALAARTVIDRAADFLDDQLHPVAATVLPANSWSRAVRRVGRHLPPSAPSVHRLTGQAWFASSRETSVDSFRELGRTGAATLRHARTPRSSPDRVSARADDQGLIRWLSAATDGNGSSGRSMTGQKS